MAWPFSCETPSAIYVQGKATEAGSNGQIPILTPPQVQHLLFSTLATDLSICVKDKNSSTQKVRCGSHVKLFFSSSSRQVYNNDLSLMSIERFYLNPEELRHPFFLGGGGRLTFLTLNILKNTISVGMTTSIIPNFVQ